MTAGVELRIRRSAYRVLVHYPPDRPALSGGGPVARPLNPLSGAFTAPTYSGGMEPEEREPPVAMPCLFHDSATLASSEDYRRTIAGAYVAGANALLRVLVDDAALDPEEPLRGTVFDGSAWVECRGQRFRVLKVEPVGPSFRLPRTYHVWLSGAQGQ